MTAEPAYWRRACRELSRRDEVMARLIRSFRGDCLTGGDNAYETLCRAIVGQQISVAAADGVWSKLVQRLGRIRPQAVASCRRDVLSRCGLSRNKVVYLKNTADFFLSRRRTKAYWQGDLEQVRSDLLAIKGVGVWTFEMFAIFYLKHPDIFPVSDLGLVNAVSNLYNDGEQLEQEALFDLGAGWSPWRTVATWYLWRSMDPQPVVY